MQKPVLVSLLVALTSGLAIGTQASLNNASGRLVGPVVTGLLVNFAGGAASGVILLAIALQKDTGFLKDVHGTTPIILVASGLLGIAIITAIAYALPQVGVAAGLAAIIVGQMVVAMIVDTFGLAGGQAISLTWVRLVGLVLLLAGTWAILPRT